METIKKRFFNLLALIKYVLESKASVPFPEEENTRPYKKPYGYKLYHENEDRIEFESLELDIQQGIEEKIKTYHYLKNKFKDITRSILVLNGIKGGQISITLKFLLFLAGILKNKGIKMSYKRIKKVTYKIPSFEPRGFKSIKDIFLKRKKAATLCELYIEYEDSKISISILIYNKVDSDMPLVSFIENTIEDNNGENLLKKMEMEIDRIIRLIPISDIFWFKNLIPWFFESYGIFGC